MTPKGTTGVEHVPLTLTYEPLEKTNSMFCATYTVLAIRKPRNTTTITVTTRQHMKWPRPFENQFLHTKLQQMHDINNPMAPRTSPVTPASCRGMHATIFVAPRIICEWMSIICYGLFLAHFKVVQPGIFLFPVDGSVRKDMYDPLTVSSPNFPFVDFSLVRIILIRMWSSSWRFHIKSSF